MPADSSNLVVSPHFLESALCPSVASIYDTEQEIIEKIQRCRCQSCKYSWQKLKSTNIKAFEMLEKN